MLVTLEKAGADTVKPRSAFILRFVSTIALWSIALVIAFSGFEVLFWFLICVFGLIALWEFYRMLDHAGLPNFKITGLICGAIMLIALSARASDGMTVCAAFAARMSGCAWSVIF